MFTDEMKGMHLGTSATPEAQREVARLFWIWYETIKDESVKANFIFFKVRVRVSAIKPFLVRIFGEPA